MTTAPSQTPPTSDAMDSANAAAIVEQFISVAVHDLRNPVAVVRASAQMAMRQWDRGDGPAARNRVQAIVSQTDRLSDLLETFLDAARIQAGKLTLHREPVSVQEIVEQAAQRALLYAGDNAGRSLQVDLPDGVVGTWDRARAIRAVKALVENAYLYGDSQTPVSVAGRMSGGNLVLRFRGHGPGPLPTEVPRLFECFFRGHAAAEFGHPGSGLGLYTARGIARLHGGDARYVPDDGADTFDLEMPLDAGS